MTTEQVEQKLKENNLSWDDFQNWMQGQTVGANEDGSTNWYDWDVERFIKHRLRNTKENSAEWD